MNTTELAEKIASEHNLSKAEVKRMVEAVLSTIAHRQPGRGDLLGVGSGSSR